MTADRALDFVVIGAQKAGTTTLFHLLREHSQLWLPRSKEAPFFNRPELYRDGRGDLIQTFFGDAPEGRKLGKVSPDYMCHPGVAGNLHAAFPEVKVIAILREPVARARSHHRMMLRRREEHRTFEGAARDQLDAIEAGRRTRSGTETYVAWGEYGRILQDYRRFFPTEQFLLLATDDLENEPAATMQSVHRFLDVETVTPDNIGEHYHVGGNRQRIPGLQHAAERSLLLRRIWHLLPQRHRDLIFFRFDQWNISHDAGEEEAEAVSAELIAELGKHYQEDAELLSASMNFHLPWSKPA